MFSTKIVDLKTNYQKKPLGISPNKVNFSWKMDSSRKGARQESYQLIIEKDNELVWDSEIVKSATSFSIACPILFEERTLYHWYVKVCNDLEEWIISDYSCFETGVTEDESWQSAEFISLTENSEIASTFIFEKKLSTSFTSVRLYITAIGVYQFAINGQSFDIKDELPYLNPGYGNGSVSLSYQTYDISKFIQNSTRLHVAIMAGNGWAAGMDQISGRPSVKAMLVLKNRADEEIIVTNTKEWFGTLEGDIRKNGIYYGEDIDTNYISLTDFCGCVLEKKALVSNHYPGKIVSRLGLNGFTLPKKALSPISACIYQGEMEQSNYEGGEIKVLKKWTPQVNENHIFIEPNQVLLLDFGQNMTAIPSIKIKAAKKTQIEMKFSEMLNDGREWDKKNHSTKGDGPKGAPYFKSLRNSRSSVHLTASEKEVDEYQSSFSFFGYRYMTITVNQTTEVLSILSVPISSVTKEIGYLETNNSSVNKLIENVKFSQLSNYFTTATDCPQRDERLFWSGDTQVFAQTALYNFDSLNFLMDIQNIMSENTLIKGYTPMVVDQVEDEYFSLFSAGWSDALVIVLWTLYLHTGDKEFLNDHYSALLTYTHYLEKHERQPDAAPLEGDRNCGDWLSFQGTSVAMMGDFYYAFVISIIEKIALELEKQEEAAYFKTKYKAIKKAFLKNHVEENRELLLRSGNLDSASYQFFGQGEGKKGGLWEDNSQTVLLWFLKLSFYQDEKMKNQALKFLINNIRNEQPKVGSIRQKHTKNSLAIGFLGINILAPVLTDFGFGNVAYDLLLQTKSPSWLFEVESGATTIWERWNSYDPEAGFGDSEMNSFNHYSYGAIAEWLYHYTLGIMIDKRKPGFQHIILQPTIDTGEKYNHQERINRVKGSYDSPYGNIKVKWHSQKNGLVDYFVSLPANTKATLYLPVEDNQALSFVEKELTGKKVEHNGRSCLEFKLSGGEWRFSL